MELQIEQDNFAKSAEEMEPAFSAATPESDMSGKRHVKKTKRMLEFEADEATSQQMAKKTPKKVQPGNNAEKTAGRKSSQAKGDKLQDAIKRANAQKAVCQQMLTSKSPTFETSTLVVPKSDDDSDYDDYDFDFFEEDEDYSPVNSPVLSIERKVEKSAVEDQREVEKSTLEKQVKELKAKLQVAQNRISELETSRQKSSLPHLSVAVTPKKFQLMKDFYRIMESAADGGPSGNCTMGRRGLQMMPKTKPIGGQDRDPLPPTLTTEKLNAPSTTSSEVLTPLYPGGKPMLPEKAKCIAFSKGKCKESLLYALLTAIFGIEVLARSNALGARRAVNKVGHKEHHPLDQDKLHEIKGQNECANIVSNQCEHMCVDTPTSFKCVCYDGYVLKDDGKTCTDEPTEERLYFIVQVVVVLFIIVVCFLFVIMVIKYSKKIWRFLRPEDAADWQTVHPSDPICYIKPKPLRNNEQMQRYLDDIDTRTDTFTDDCTPSEVLSLDETVVTDGCQYVEHRQKPVPLREPLLYQVDVQSRNLRKSNEYDPLTQDVPNLDQNSNKIGNGFIAHEH